MATTCIRIYYPDDSKFFAYIKNEDDVKKVIDKYKKDSRKITIQKMPFSKNKVQDWFELEKISG